MPGQIRQNCSRVFEGLSYLAYEKLMLSYIFIHIIQLYLFSSEYWPIAGKKVNIHSTEKGDLNYVNKKL